MLSPTTASTHLIFFPQTLINFNTHFFPSCFLVFNAEKRAKRREKLVSLSLVAGKESVLGFVEVKRRDCRGYCGCKDWDSEGDFGLETEILEFMRKSVKPEVFPSKKELVDAGRIDLVEAIVSQGGWLASGWDLNDEANEEDKFDVQDLDFKMMERECDNGAVESGEESTSLEDSERRSFGVSSSGRSLETATDSDSGIKGILNRLEKERNMNFGFVLREKGSSARVQSKGSQDDLLSGISTDAEAGELHNDSEGKLSQNKSLSGIDGLRNSHKPEMWRTWSIQRAGFSDMEFEAAEISSNETGGVMDVSVDEILEIREGRTEPLNRKKEFNSSHEEINHNQLRSRLQHLELELSSALHSLRSNTDEVASQKGNESSSDDYQKLSDAWEFQENEIMNAQDKIRSIRAKLAVLEGKMALAIIDAQKMVEEKQKRIDDARRALRLLRTACIVWPNSASEVLLAGSYDGWSTQRKMEKSSTGIFSLGLKLYPGRYEIKFIVDGEWRIDPLRPILHNSGYENNLLIIT